MVCEFHMLAHLSRGSCVCVCVCVCVRAHIFTLVCVLSPLWLFANVCVYALTHVLWTVVCENMHSHMCYGLWYVKIATQSKSKFLLAIQVFPLSVVSFSQCIGSMLLKQAGRVNLGSTSLHGESLGFQFLKKVLFFHPESWQDKLPC